ncbi:hypothetical protein B0H10DRAFT_2008236 [Mycena sp. CBHHK59/15]|nr:hypothetical protein B0H10DRAFT_2008236 [Mycena sp. CBHHK59/15]
MPTATSTLTMTDLPPKKLKATVPLAPSSPQPSAIATLRTLYNRAARGFLHREVALVHSLLESAFALLHPPQPADHPDELAPHRSKWDILRITLETTIYASPPSDELPERLRELLTQPSHGLSHRHTTAHSASSPREPHPKRLRSSRLLLKLDAPDAGRVIIEDWLASRHYSPFSAVSAEEERINYSKVVEAYCVYILPKLEQWEYAKEFLEYESELSSDAREPQVLVTSLHAQTIAERLPPTPPPRVPGSPSLSSPRPYSPTPSTSSSSSLSSSASMHTVVPATPRPRSKLSSKPAVARATATPRAKPSVLPVASPPRAHHLAPRLYPPGSARTAAPPSTYALLKASLATYLPPHARLSAISLATFVLLLVLSLLVRRRRRAENPIKAGGDVAGGNAELVRRRLLAASAASGGSAGVLGRALSAVIRAVGDTVRMGGGGLV